MLYLIFDLLEVGRPVGVGGGGALLYKNIPSTNLSHSGRTSFYEIVMVQAKEKINGFKNIVLVLSGLSHLSTSRMITGCHISV